MSKRLQVLLDEAELDDVREAARREGVPVSEWVRRALREARRREPRGDVDRKLQALQKAMQYEFPAPDIDQMLAETEQGYLEDLPE
jgi:Ribbon-helix-helix protein, copG family